MNWRDFDKVLAQTSKSAVAKFRNGHFYANMFILTTATFPGRTSHLVEILSR